MRMTRAALACACLLGSLVLASVAAAQCEGISWTYADPILTVRHDAEYNCAVFRFRQEAAPEGTVLVVREYAIASAWADCMCPYQTELRIGGLLPGDYTLRFEYGEQVADEPPAWWTWCELPLVIPGANRDDAEFSIIDASASGCGIVTAVPEVMFEEIATWGTFKARYR